MKTVEKIAELEYNELITLGVIEQNDDLKEIFTEEIKMPFNILYRLQKEGSLNDRTKELLVDMFEKVILTSKTFVDKYQRLASGIDTTKTDPVEVVVKVVEETKQPEVKPEPIENVIFKTEAYKVKHDKPVEEKIKDKVSVKQTKAKEVEIPRRYGKEKIQQDIQAQGGKATPVQRAMLKVNDLKNIYVNLSTRGIKDMVAGAESLSDEDCRKIVSAITTFERQMADIVKTKATKK